MACFLSRVDGFVSFEPNVPFNKHVTVEGEEGVHEIYDKPLRKFRGEGGQGLPFT